MSESRILAAFWQPKSRRFCELTVEEIRARSGVDTDGGEFRQLTQHKVIRKQVICSTSPVSVYRLSPEGERRVSAMVVLGKLPKINRRLTAIPKEAAE